MLFKENIMENTMYQTALDRQTCEHIVNSVFSKENVPCRGWHIFEVLDIDCDTTLIRVLHNQYMYIVGIEVNNNDFRIKLIYEDDEQCKDIEMPTLKSIIDRQRGN